MIQESASNCPQCSNVLIFDQQKSIKYCRNKACQGLIVEFGYITYENEVNLHEEEGPAKQNRFGGYVSKKENFISQLVEHMNSLDSRARERIYQKFEKGERIIRQLVNQFEINEATLKEMLFKYRDLLLVHADDRTKIAFDVLAVVSFILIFQEKKKEWAGTHLKHLTHDIICQFGGVTHDQVALVIKKLSANHERGHQRLREQEELMKSSQQFPFNEEELESLRRFYNNLMNSPLIRGQKPQTLYSVAQLCICILSANPLLHNQTIESIATKNGVTKETVKSIWAQICDPLVTEFRELVPSWTLRRPISELKKAS